MAYRETVRVQPTDSDWASPYLGFGVRWTSPALTSDGLVVRIGGAFRGSGTGNEEWTLQGARIQRNNLRFEDGSCSAEAGLPLYRGQASVLRGFAGVRYARQRFVRDAFRVPDLPAPVNVRVNEIFDLGSATLGLDLTVVASERLSFIAAGTTAYVFAYSADNSAFGRVDGDDGVCLDLDAGLRWAAGRERHLKFSLVHMLCALNGGSKPFVAAGTRGTAQTAVIELPDNELEALGVRVSWVMPL